MQAIKLASSLLVVTLLAACSSMQTSQTGSEDAFDPNTLPATAAGTMTPNGYIRYWEYDNITGSVADIYASPDYPLLYSKSRRLTSMSRTVKLSNAGVRMAGYLIPGITGEYHFQLEASSGGELWLSNDKTAYKKRKVIHLDGTSEVKIATTKVAITLEAGQPYFIEALAKINNPTDVLNVSWSYPMPSSSGEAAMSPMEIIPGSVVRSYGRNKTETPSDSYLDGVQAGYAMGYKDALLGLDYSSTYPQTDTDFDGIPDKWEEAYGLDPLNYADAGQDYDGDGLSAFDEYTLRTEPYISDTDNDGIPDGWEVQHGLNPHNPADAQADRNGDGVSNLDEWMIAVGLLPPINGGSGTPSQNSLYISWQAPTKRVNGEPFTEADIKQYVIRYKLLDAETYTEVVINDPNATEYQIDAEPGTYTITISVVDNDGLESSFAPTENKVVE